ncbi:hypothetical protein DAPPUDRAFT_334825 [Daphnia pulex]|uniref:Uncharacterized protein n=1 Tax=Daphnia pulex TaxID=6669 RepID=E9HWG7_DAPPU|nr:hypothetical protein DAPPUDRAFT_334825 [Daphnia pulex]|eukprot:EFX63913.1 hypothetical protein DAPPUDRAFT_334825 [Daphnia pulex]
MASSGDSDEPQDDSFSTDEETFQVGRIQQFWKGTYNEILPEVGSHPLGGNSSSEVKFFIVTTVECGEDRIKRQVHSIIPTGWISSNMEYLLYPQPRFTVGGKSPIDWGEKTFRRFQILFESWMEYDIHPILNQTKAAIKAAKAAANGQPILSDAFISDSDRILGRGLRKAAQKRPFEDPGVGHHDKELESPPSFTTFDEFTRLDAVYTPSSNRNKDNPLSWANGGDLLQLNGYQSSKAFSSFDVQTLMRAIEQVEKKLDWLGSKVMEKLDSVSKRMEESFKNDLPLKATKHANYHRWIVESNFGSVSCDTVFFISERYKAFVNQAYRLFLCDETSQKMQWRSVGRVNDLRPGLSGLMNMLSVIGVALNIFNLLRNTANVDHRKLIEMIKNCRKYNAKNYRKKNNVRGALEMDASAEAPQLPNANDDVDAVIFNNYMTCLEKEVVNFKPPPTFDRAPDLCN